MNAPAVRRLLDEQDYDALDRVAEAPAPEPQEPRHNGMHYRMLRLSSHRTLREVAAASGLSVSFLSAIERGVSGMSPGAEARLRAALEGAAPVDEQPPDVIHRIGSGRAVDVAPGITYEWLSKSDRLLLEPQLVVIAPGSASDWDMQHGGEEFVVVLTGSIAFWLRSLRFEMTAGDTIHFRSHEPHRWANEGQAAATVLWVTTERGVWQSGRGASNLETIYAYQEEGRPTSHRDHRDPRKRA